MTRSRRVAKQAAAVGSTERAVFNLHVPPARTPIDRAAALDRNAARREGRRR